MQPEQIPPQAPIPLQPNQSETPPTQNWQQPETIPPRRGNRKKILLIALVAFVVILCGAVLIKMLSGNQKDDTKQGPNRSDAAIYKEREGYNPADLGETIGDPFALNLSKYDDPFKIASGPLVFACNVLTVNDLASQKAYVAANSEPNAVSRIFIDGVGIEGPKVNNSTVPDGSKDGNNCRYQLQDGAGVLEMNVYQPPLVATRAIQDQISRLYASADSVNGLPTYKRKEESDKKTHSYILISGNDALDIRFDSDKLSEVKRSELLKLAAKNFVDLHSTPKGPALVSYDTPTYKKAYARACDMISNDDIKSLTGNNASLYATEGLATATGVAKVGGNLYNYLTTSCSRYNTALGSGLTAGPFDQQLDLKITSFQNDAPAKFLLSEKTKDTNEKTAANIGDEGYGFRDVSGQNAVVFRQGRFVVELYFNRTVQANAGLTEVGAMNQKLTPYSQALATKLKAKE